jgi:hypothetical protein
MFEVGQAEVDDRSDGLPGRQGLIRGIKDGLVPRADHEGYTGDLESTSRFLKYFLRKVAIKIGRFRLETQPFELKKGILKFLAERW